jgi:hypothetical protein
VSIEKRKVKYAEKPALLKLSKVRSLKGHAEEPKAKSFITTQLVRSGKGPGSLMANSNRMSFVESSQPKTTKNNVKADFAFL